MRLVPHLFCWRTSLIDALSSYVKRMFINKQWCYTVFPIVFPVELGCFHLFLSHYKLLKIFARNSHMLLRIDYISTCVIHFKCTLLLEDIISWHVRGRFFMAHSVLFTRVQSRRYTCILSFFICLKASSVNKLHDHNTVMNIQTGQPRKSPYADDCPT